MNTYIHTGSIHDSRMLEHSWIYKEVEKDNSSIMNAPTLKIKDTEMAPYLVGDHAYPVLKWLMKPYPYGTREHIRKNFNYQLSKGRSCIERSFGVLKNRYRILNKKIEFSPRKAAQIFVLCCMLHNFLQQNGDEDNVDFDIDQSGAHASYNSNGNRVGEKKRKLLSQYLLGF